MRHSFLCLERVSGWRPCAAGYNNRVLELGAVHATATYSAVDSTNSCSVAYMDSRYGRRCSGWPRRVWRGFLQREFQRSKPHPPRGSIAADIPGEYFIFTNCRNTRVRFERATVELGKRV